MAKTQRQSTTELKSIKESQPKTISTKTSAGGYKETTVRNADGSTTSTANKPQYGTSGTVNNSDGSKTVYSGGGYSSYDSSGRQTGAGLYGTENWDSSIGNNYAELPGYKSSGGSSGGGGGTYASKYENQPAQQVQPNFYDSLMSDYNARISSIQRMLDEQTSLYKQSQVDYQNRIVQEEAKRVAQQQEYDRQVKEMNNKLSYKVAEQGNQFNSVLSPSRNGVQLFNPGGGAQDVQINANGASNAVDGADGSYNNVLNRYLNNIWTGGF